MKTRYLLLVCASCVVGYDTGLADMAGCDGPSARQFDFWIGEWDVENQQANPAAPGDSTLYRTGTAEVRVYPVADGCALVEHWEGNLSWGRVQGFSVRSYDPRTGNWMLLLNWPAPGSGQPARFSTLEGVFRHGRGEFFNSFIGADGNPATSRFTFSDISADSYRWDAASSADAGLTWKTTWIMEGKRRNALNHGPVRAGPQLASASDGCAATPESEALAFLEGEWAGQTEDQLSVELEVIRILGGCAVMEFLKVGETPQLNEFRVRAYQPDKGQWIQYSVNNRSGGFSRFIATLEANRVEWKMDDTPGDSETLRLDTSERLRWKRSRGKERDLEAELRKRP